jgi:hypothetical protein
MLWKRKLYKKRVQRNEQKKVRKQFFKTKEGEASEGGDVTLVNEGTVVDDKKKKSGVKESEVKEEEVKEGKD